MLTRDDVNSGKIYEDTVGIIPRFGPSSSEGGSFLYFPYRALVPAKVEGLLVAGRSFSSDAAANNMINLIPHCIIMGQAAGTGAALALQNGVSVRQVNYKELQKSLSGQGVPLPSEIKQEKAGAR